ncbi:MAG: FAD-dependent oxidoreductase [Dehalococcoidia bacterium]
MVERLVVIGGDAGGMSAASEARRRRPSSDLEIVVYERGGWISFSACGEPYFVGGEVEALEDLVARTPEQFADRDIEVHLFHEVTAIDAVNRTVTVRNVHRDVEFETPYDDLLIATGAAAVRPHIPGLDLEGVAFMRTLDDATALRALIEGGARRAVVVGGGYIGVEVAEALTRRDLQTTMVTAGESALEGAFDPEIGDRVVARMREIGIEFRAGLTAERVEGASGRVRAVEAGGERFEADIVVIAIGARPTVALAEAAGVPLGESGAIAIDDHQRTLIPGIWAAGDCAESHHRVGGHAVNIQLGTVANKQGRIAGVNLGGGDERFPGVLGTAISRLCDLEVARTGLTEAEAADLGIEAVTVAFNSRTAAGYWPEAERLHMKALAEVGSGRLLGAQIVGGTGAGKRIDAFAMALWNGMTAFDLVNVDLSYAPPFSGVWDPVLVAARELTDALESHTG